MGDISYSQTFYDDLKNTALPSAKVVVPMLLDMYPAKSVIDAGCGDGSWLSVFKENGAETVFGVDGNWVDVSQLRISEKNFERRSLDKSIDVDEHFDLSMSLEVAEHLPPERAKGFVDELCALAPVVLFSAAIPDQGGHHHINEQWPAYWAEYFAANGYRLIDTLRLTIWNRDDVCWWYKQNLLLFASEEALQQHPRLKMAADRSPAVPPALVHPVLLGEKTRKANPSFGRWIKMGGKAWSNSRTKRQNRRKS